jgi:hypothetical protein
MSWKIAVTAFSLIATLMSTTANALAGTQPQVNSNSQSSQKTKSNQNFAANFKPPRKGQPEYTVGGATRRDSCAIAQEDKNEITALVPERKQSLTFASHPSIFAYVSALDSDKSATLIVKDQTEDYYYSQQLMLPATGGVIKMTLAEDAPPLELGKDYTWFLRIQCNIHPEPEDPQIHASITRVAGHVPSLIQEDMVSFYANSQIWYDSLNTAFALSQSGKNIYWSQLMSSIDQDWTLDKPLHDSLAK